MSYRRLFSCVCAVAAACGLMGRAAAQCGRSWVAAPNGVVMTNPDNDSYVTAMTSWDPDGAGPLPSVVVVAGRFEWVGGTTCNNIGYYDGAAWHPLALGLNNLVSSLAVVNGQLYAGGYFSGSGLTTLHYLARWTGSAWQEPAGGTDGPVQMLMANGSELVVGGSFTHVAGTSIAARFAARLTGSTWTAYATNPPYQVSRGVMFNNQPYVICNNLGDDSSRLVRFNNATGAWDLIRSLSQGYAGPLIAFSGGVFFTDFVSGVNQFCDHYSENTIWRYDGTTTTRVDAYNDANAFALYNGELYAVGSHHAFCPSVIGGFGYTSWMGKWNGSAFVNTPLNPGNGSSVSAMLAVNGTFYIGGSFDQVGNLKANNVARLNGATYESLPDSFDGLARCATTIGSTFYVGGDFNNFGTTSLGHLGYFNGTGWSSLGQFNGTVNAIGYFSPNPITIIGAGVIVSGSFTTINGTAFNRIARRDSTNGTWVAIGTGLNAPALSFVSYATSQLHNDLIVGGQFTSAGGVGCNYVARWTGAAWQPMSTGMSAEVRAMAWHNGVLYAGGYFTSASGITCNFIAQWTGSFWFPVGGGMNDVVRALASYNGRLYAAGDFTAAGGVAANHIAAWNGTSWSAVGDGLDSSVLALTNSGTSLVAGGFFTHSGTLACSHVAQWNDSAWDTVGANFYTSSDGVDGNVIGMAVSSSGDLIVAGQMSHAAGQASSYAARALVPAHLSARTQPTSAGACLGGSATFVFDVNSSWTAPATFQWYRNGYAISNGTTPSGSAISGATTAMLAIDNAHIADAGDLWCTVDNTCGEHISSNTVTFSVGGPTCAPTCGSADYNCDGDLGTDADIAAFFACLSGNCPPLPCTSSADFNGDGDLGADADIAAFFRVLSGGAC